LTALFPPESPSIKEERSLPNALTTPLPVMTTRFTKTSSFLTLYVSGNYFDINSRNTHNLKRMFQKEKRIKLYTQASLFKLSVFFTTGTS